MMKRRQFMMELKGADLESQHELESFSFNESINEVAQV